MKRFKEFITNPKLLFWFFWTIMVLPNVVMFFTEDMPLFTRIVNIILPASFLLLAMTLSRKPGKMFWWLFLFSFYAAFELVLLYLFGESPIAVDMFLNVITTNPTEVDELLSNLLPIVLFVIVLYGVVSMPISVMSIRAKNKLSKSFERRVRRVSLVAVGLSLLALSLNWAYVPSFRLLDDIFPVNVTYNLVLAVQRAAKSANYKETSKNFTYKAHKSQNDTIPEVYVLVVGETSRADNWSLFGYERETNPELKTIDGIVTYNDAISMSNTTHKSVPMLITPIASEQFDSVYYRKGIITAYKEAGFQTAYYSNQRRNHSFIDFFGEEAHDVKFIKDDVPMTANPRDGELVKLVEKKLKDFKGGKLFIVLHLYGSHFNYYDRCPAEFAKFKPCKVFASEKRYRKQLVNAYDNSIVYTDHVLAGIIRAVDSCSVRSAVFFTSDHGEDIYDDSRGRFLHASPLPTYFQLRVPLLVWTSKQYATDCPDRVKNLEANKNKPISTNLVMFHTVLDMCGIETPFLNRELSLGSEKFTATPRQYVNDHNEKRSITNVGLKKIDEQHFKKHGIEYK